MANFDPFGGTGGELANFTIATDVVPVRIINTNPIKVLVMNFPGVPPPLPDMLTPPIALPPLPKRPAAIPPPGLDMVTAAKSVVGALGVVKKTFVDPFIGIAKAGFDAGLHKGAGAGTLFKSFETLGVAIGVTLIPAVIKLSVAALEAADAWIGEKQRIKQFRAEGGVLGIDFDNAGRRIDRGPNDKRSWLGMFDDWSDRNFGGGAAGFISNNLGVGRMTPEERKKWNRDHATGPAMDKNTEMILTSLRNGAGGSHAMYMGLSDIREQAQMAAQVDPLEALQRKLIIDAINDWMTSGRQNLEKTANNTKAK